MAPLSRNDPALSIVGYYELSAERSDSHWEKSMYTEANAIFFERWMQLVGTPFLPMGKKEFQSVYSSVERQLGGKFSIFRRRFDETRKASERKETD